MKNIFILSFSVLLLTLLSVTGYSDEVQQKKEDLLEKSEMLENEAYQLSDSASQEKYVDKLIELGNLYIDLSKIERRNEHLSGALNSFEKAFEAASEAGYKSGVALASIGVGDIYVEQLTDKNHDRILPIALMGYDRALAEGIPGLSKEIITKTRGKAGKLYLQLSFMRQSLKNIKQAIRHLNASRKGYEWGAEKGFPIEVQLNLGIAYYYLGCYEKTSQNLRTALIYFERLIRDTEYSEDSDEHLRLKVLIEAVENDLRHVNDAKKYFPVSAPYYIEALYSWTPYWKPGESTKYFITSGEEQLKLWEKQGVKLFLFRAHLLLREAVNLNKQIISKESKYARSLIGLGKTEVELGKLDKNAKRIEEGIYNLRVGRKVIVTRDENKWAEATLEVAEAYIHLSDIADKKLNLEKALKEISKVSKKISSSKQPSLYTHMKQTEKRARKELGSR